MSASRSGNGIDAVHVGNIAMVPDRFGTPGAAASFGGNHYYEVVDHPLLPEGAAPRTVSTWIRTTPNGVQSFLNWGSTVSGQRFGLIVHADGSPYFVGQNRDVKGPDVGLDDGAWHNFVATYDGTTVTVYIDVLDTTGTNLEIGRTAFDHNAEPFVGVLDDVRIYDRVLTDVELGALYTEDGWR